MDRFVADNYISMYTMELAYNNSWEDGGGSLSASDDEYEELYNTTIWDTMLQVWKHLCCQSPVRARLLHVDACLPCGAPIPSYAAVACDSLRLRDLMACAVTISLLPNLRRRRKIPARMCSLFTASERELPS